MRERFMLADPEILGIPSSTSTTALCDLIYQHIKPLIYRGQIYHWDHLRDSVSDRDGWDLQGMISPCRCCVDVQVPTTPAALHTPPSCTPSNLNPS